MKVVVCEGLKQGVEKEEKEVRVVKKTPLALRGKGREGQDERVRSWRKWVKTERQRRIRSWRCALAVQRPEEEEEEARIVVGHRRRLRPMQPSSAWPSSSTL